MRRGNVQHASVHAWTSSGQQQQQQQDISYGGEMIYDSFAQRATMPQQQQQQDHRNQQQHSPLNEDSGYDCPSSVRSVASNPWEQQQQQQMQYNSYPQAAFQTDDSAPSPPQQQQQQQQQMNYHDQYQQSSNTNPAEINPHFEDHETTTQEDLSLIMDAVLKTMGGSEDVQELLRAEEEAMVLDALDGGANG